jgi:hypothetical protein
MIGLLGPPPRKLLEMSDPEAYSRYFNKKGELDSQKNASLLTVIFLTGHFKYPHLIPKTFTIESLVPFMDGEDKRLFVALARRMLKWLPEERATAAELASDPWLTFGY